ncbi:proto-oncogene serine/threonine-protein kinase mos [Alosa alosa]|uniref:proto-oncogene serine/threonine-protein kinase mos n=1 Tax=Alosa alosa TaxID=278164 RepID=UPI0020150A06|nr:proto-oncogene serine/threonine-protein kinase mos [Alosa alosa]
MPSPIPVTRLLPKDFRPSVELGACSSPLIKYAGGSTLAVPAHTFRSKVASRLWSSVIHWNELHCLEPLGTGGFGSVYKGMYFGETVAVKKVKRYSKNKLASRQSFWAELNAAHLRHKNLVRVIAATTSIPADPENADNIGTIIMELAGTRNLQHVIYGSAEPLVESRCMTYSTDIARGLEYLHAHNVVHLDVKPANIIVSDADVCKLADFGCSLKLECSGELSPLTNYMGGTYTHRAPELLKGEEVTLKADVYAFGITLWQLLAREMPYQGDRQCILYAVVAYELRPPVNGERFRDSRFGRMCKALLVRCWSANLNQRPTAERLVRELNMMSG